MRYIISFDLDMTLLDHATWKIPDSALRAVEQLRRDHIIVVASGRDMDNQFSYMYRDQLQPDAIIHMNGTKITVGDTLIYNHLMDRSLVERLLTFARDEGLCLGVSTQGKDYYVTPELVVKGDMARWGKSLRDFQDPFKLADMEVRTLAYIGGEEGVRRLEAEFPELKFPMFAGRQGADVVEKKASKAEGLKRLCAYYGIGLDHTVAFGDSMNDYEIVTAAGIGVAMGNAIEELKEAADYVTADVGDDGVWKACLELGLMSHLAPVSCIKENSGEE